MERQRETQLKKIYDFNRKTRYQKELEKVDKRFRFLWNKFTKEWAIFQSGKLVCMYKSERQGINHVKSIFHFHRTTPNANATIDRLEKESYEKAEQNRKDQIDEFATEAGERGVVGVHGVTPMVTLGG